MARNMVTYFGLSFYASSLKQSSHVGLLLVYCSVAYSLVMQTYYLFTATSRTVWSYKYIALFAALRVGHSPGILTVLFDLNLPLTIDSKQTIVFNCFVEN